MLRGGIWRNQSRFNRALSFRAGQAHRNWRESDHSPTTSPTSRSAYSTRDGDHSSAGRSTSQTPPDSQKSADGALPWRTSVAPPSANAAGPSAGAKGWGSSWGPPSSAVRSEGADSGPFDGLLPHERAARDEAARRKATAAATAAASQPAAPPTTEEKKPQRASGPSISSPPRMPGNTAPHFPRIVPARRPTSFRRDERSPPRPSMGHDSHQSSSRTPRSERPEFRPEPHRQSSKAPFASLKAELNASSSFRDDARLSRSTPRENTARTGLDSIAGGDGGGSRPEWGHLRRRPSEQPSSGGDNSFDALLASTTPTLRKPVRKHAAPSETRSQASGDPWARVQDGLAKQESKEESADSGSWDWVDNFETNRRARARVEEATIPPSEAFAREPIAQTPFVSSQEGIGREGAWRRDQGHRSHPDRGVDRRGRREFPQKQKGRRQRHNDGEDEEFDEDILVERRRRKAEKKAQRERELQRSAKQAGPTPILLPEFISVSNLAVALGMKQDLFLRQLEELGFESIGQESIMTGETAALVAQEYGFEPSVDVGEGVDLKPRPVPQDPSTLPPRPPVVTIMGHVDHGKTTLLDWLRKSSVAAQEHGGITQHIGAFSVRMSAGKQITFLDTPGHAAFLTMRQRGANVTDIVILVVAADDSVKPQTIEALKHARAAKVPIIVAINKVDKEEARVDLVKSDLAKNGVEIEDYGGDVQVVCVSGKTGLGMDDLEENIILLSEILDMRAESDGMAEGWVLESSVKPIGRVATVLVKRGTLRTGDCIVAGKVWGKVRVLRNEAGVEINEAPPGTPVEILGWKELPDAGDQVLQAPDEGKAKDAAHYRIENSEREKAVADIARLDQEKREREKAAASDGADESHETDAESPGTKTINFVVKGDVHGSVEAVCASVMEIGSNEVLPRILRSATGQITESDVEHAATSGSSIINFNNPIPGHIKGMADDAGVKILDHTIIYHLTDDIRNTLSEHLAPLITTKVLGEAEVLQVFPINLKGRVFKNIAGCRVRNGLVGKNAKYRVLRRGETVFEGDVDSIKHGKKDVPEIRKGAECGISFVDWEGFRQGDQIQAFEEISTKRHL